MTSLEPTLTKMRLMEAFNKRILTELSQPLDDFIKEIQAYYKSKRVNVPYDMVKSIVDILGIEDAQSEAGLNMAKRLKKNPSRFVTTILHAFKKEPKDLVQHINQEKNVANDPEVLENIKLMLKAMLSTESHSSATHSILDTLSTDFYIALMDNKEKEDAIHKVMELLKQAVPAMEKQAEGFEKWVMLQIKGKNPYFGKDLTGDAVALKSGEEGTVIIDSDNKTLTQEDLDAISQAIERMVPNTHFDIADVQAEVSHIWVLATGEQGPGYIVKDADKGEIVPKHFKPVLDTMASNPNKYSLATQIIASIDNEYQQDNAIDTIVHARSTGDDFDNAASKLGFNMNKYKSLYGVKPDKADHNSLKLPITMGNNSSAAVKILSWLKQKGSRNLSITAENIIIFGNMQRNYTLINSDFSVAFSQSPPKLNFINTIIINNANKQEFDDYCIKEHMKVRATQVGNKLEIRNLR